MTELVISFEVDGLHFWPGAPDKYKEFGQLHRHLFKVICFLPMADSDDPNRRQVELWELRQDTIRAVDMGFPNQRGITNFGPMSCEGISDTIRKMMGFSKVFVGEEWFQGVICY